MNRITIAITVFLAAIAISNSQQFPGGPHGGPPGGGAGGGAGAGGQGGLGGSFGFGGSVGGNAGAGTSAGASGGASGGASAGSSGTAGLVGRGLNAKLMGEHVASCNGGNNQAAPTTGAPTTAATKK